VRLTTAGGNVPSGREVWLREPSVLSLRLAGEVGGGRASVVLVIEGESSGDIEHDLEMWGVGRTITQPAWDL